MYLKIQNESKTTCSLFPVPCSLFPVPCSKFLAISNYQLPFSPFPQLCH
ncbi:hypothetical protein [Moorena producens]